MGEELKRNSDWEMLIRIDENTKMIKQTLDKYPLPEMHERIDNQDRRLNKHIDGHWQLPLIISGIVSAFVAIFTFLRIGK